MASVEQITSLAFWKLVVGVCQRHYTVRFNLVPCLGGDDQHDKGDEALLEAVEAQGGVGEGAVLWILVQNDKGVGFLEEVVVGPPDLLMLATIALWPDLATLDAAALPKILGVTSSAWLMPTCASY